MKLNKEEENNEANLARGRRNRPIRTTSGSEHKKKVVRKEDEDLDFEPESEHDSDSEEEKGRTLGLGGGREIRFVNAMIVTI